MNKEILLKRIEEVVNSRDLLLIDSVLRGDNKLRIIEIFIDGEAPVTSDLCSEISYIIKEVIEAEELIDSNFRLDVSSPGVDRPLKFLIQYPKHINRKFELKFASGDEVKNVKAKLTGVEGNVLIFNDGKNEIRLNFEEIKSAKVLISF